MVIGDLWFVQRKHDSKNKMAYFVWPVVKREPLQTIDYKIKSYIIFVADRTVYAVAINQ